CYVPDLLYFSSLLCFLTLSSPPRPTRFPYTTLFRSYSPECPRTAKEPPQTHSSRLYRIPTSVIAFLRRSALTGSISVRGRLKCGDRKSTRLNSSHVSSSYAVYCL